MKSFEDQLIDYLEAYCLYDITVTRNTFRDHDVEFDSDGVLLNAIYLEVWYQDQHMFDIRGEPNSFWSKKNTYRSLSLSTQLKVKWRIKYSELGIRSIKSKGLSAWLLDGIEDKLEEDFKGWGNKARGDCRKGLAVGKLERTLPQPLDIREMGGLYGRNSGAAVSLPISNIEFSLTWEPKDQLWIAKYLNQKFVIESEDRLRSLLVQVLNIEQNISNIKY